MKRFKETLFFACFFCVPFVVFVSPHLVGCREPAPVKESAVEKTSCDSLTVKLTAVDKILQFNFVDKNTGSRKILRFESGKLSHDIAKIVTSGTPTTDEDAPGRWCTRGQIDGEDSCVVGWWNEGRCLDVIGE